MKTEKLFSVFLAALLILALLPGSSARAEASPWRVLAANFNALLEPGAWHGWGIAPSEECGAYLVEVSPHGAGMDGYRVERAIVQPEFDGTAWNDVLRVMIPEGQPALDANLRVYRTCSLPVVMEFEDTLEGGAWMGWVVGPAALDRAYLVEVTPLEPSEDGAYIEHALVQQEYFQGAWQDVLRLQLAEGFPDLRVQARVYAVERAPQVYQFKTTLLPGEPVRYTLGPAVEIGWYVIETTPVQAQAQAGEFVEHVQVQAYYQGDWQNTLLLRAAADQPSIEVQVRVYAFGSPRVLEGILAP